MLQIWMAFEMRKIRGNAKCSSEAAFAALCFVVAIAASGCVHYHPAASESSVHAKGPPPHAPAYGYRHAYYDAGVELAFDDGLGVYAVVGRPGHYWYSGRYVHWESGSWRASVRLDGAWVVISDHEIPEKLAMKYAHKARKAHRKHHRHAVPAKHQP